MADVTIFSEHRDILDSLITSRKVKSVAGATKTGFRGISTQVRTTEIDQFGKLERGGRVLHRFRVGDYRVYFELHDLGVVVHRILSRNTLKDFLYRSGLKVGEDKALQDNPSFWDLIENARHAAKG